jgi:prevent-host-death family protein
MKPVTIHQAKTNLSKLIARAERGEKIVIASGDKPIAKIVPV